MEAAGFTKASNLLLRGYHDLSDGALRTFLTILSYAWQDGYAFPSQATLAEARGKSLRSIATHIKELVGAGLLTTTRRGQGKSNIWWIERLSEGQALDYQKRYGKADGYSDVQKTAGQEVQKTAHYVDSAVQDSKAAAEAEAMPAASSLEPNDTTDTANGNGHGPQKTEALRLMTEAGLDAQAARYLLARYGAERCIRNCEGLGRREANYGPGAYRQAIEQNWTTTEQPTAEVDLRPLCQTIHDPPPEPTAASVAAGRKRQELYEQTEGAWTAWTRVAVGTDDFPVRQQAQREAEERFAQTGKIIWPPQEVEEQQQAV